MRIWCVDCGSSSLRLAAVEFVSGSTSPRVVRVVAREPVVWHDSEVPLAPLIASVRRLLEDAARSHPLPDALIVTALLGWVALDGVGRPAPAAVSYRDRRGRIAVDRGRIELPHFVRRTGRRLAPELLIAIDAATSQPPVRYTTLKDTIVASLLASPRGAPGPMELDLVQAAYSGLLREDAEWEPDREALAWIGRKELPLPPISPPSAVAGEVALAGRMVPLVRGTSDGSAGFYASLAAPYQPGTLAVTSGTTEVMMIAAPRPADDQPPAEAKHVGLTWNPIDPMAAACGARVCGASTGSVGGFLVWLSATFGCCFDDRTESAAAQLAPGSEGLLVFPALEGEREPGSIPGVSGALIGLRGHHGSAHLLRATGEAAAFRLAEIVDALEMRGIQVNSISVGGGGASHLWNSIRAEVCDRPVSAQPWREASVVGSAVIARAAITGIPIVAASQRPARDAAAADRDERDATVPAAGAVERPGVATTRSSRYGRLRAAYRNAAAAISQLTEQAQ